MSHSQFHCLAFKLRHAWLSLWDKHMTTGRINQITILKPKRANSSRQVVRFAKVWSPEGSGTCVCRPEALCFRDLQPTRSPLVKCRWEAQVQFTSKILRCKLTSSWAYAQGRSRICALVDIHTLVTHNDTIIFCSLREGLTYSLCA